MKRPLGVTALSLLIACNAGLILDALLVPLSHTTVPPDLVVISIMRVLVAGRLAFGLWALRDWARRGVIFFAVVRLLIMGYLLQARELTALTDRLHTLVPSIPGFQYSAELNFLLILWVVIYLMSPAAREAFDRAKFLSARSY